MRMLVDTSAWIETLRPRGDEMLRGLVREATRAGGAVLCDQVRLELWNGVGDLAEQRQLRLLEQELETLPTTPAVWQRARELARRSRAAGLSAPAADILIVACGIEHGCGLIHRDSHLEKILGVAAGP